MARRKKRNLLVSGLLLIPLATVLSSRLHCPANRPTNEEDQGVTLVGHTHPIQALAFSRDGTTLTTAACILGDGRGEMEVTVWDTKTGKSQVTRTAVLGDLLAWALAPGGHTLAVSRMDGTVCLWDVAAARKPYQLGNLDWMVSALAFSGTGSRLATAD